ncbi:MAG: thioredoxin family protein [Chitinophagaceae bacterium]|nr:thioredoxin family protein [Chitinophagaceae bacterium]
MRTIAALCLLAGLSSFTGWKTNMTEARQEAATRHKYILLNFSGSDWCVPCMQMHREIFENPAFQTFAEQSLVLVNADFPRQKKNQLSRQQQQENEALADRYDNTGVFPLTVLLDENGKVLKQWEGNPGISADRFIAAVKAVTDGGR